ncbi:hypothetical protein V8E53_011591, partial [Lactarius tabidus]
LPLELLQRIFLCLVCSRVCSLVDYFNGQPDLSWCCPSWIEIRYVCCYWRSAALDLHELWSFITPHLSSAWTHVMIEQSSPHPIDIVIPLKNPCIESCSGFGPLDASELLSSSRIRTLGLFGTPSIVLNLLDFLNHSSQLESLILRVPHWGDPVGLPESLCGRDAPHLHRLALYSNTVIRMPLWLLANITHFTNDMCISLDHLLRMLVAMPQLKVLSIIRIFNDRESADPHKHLPLPPPIKLPRLSLLSISDSIANSFIVTCRWHVLLDLSGFRTMATLLVLRPALKPIGTQSMSQLLRVWDNVRRLRGCEGTEEYPVRTRW